MLTKEQKDKLSEILMDKESKVFHIVETLKAILTDCTDIDKIYEAKGYISLEGLEDFRVVNYFDDAEELIILTRDYLKVEL